MVKSNIKVELIRNQSMCFCFFLFIAIIFFSIYSSNKVCQMILKLVVKSI